MKTRIRERNAAWPAECSTGEIASTKAHSQPAAQQRNATEDRGVQLDQTCLAHRMDLGKYLDESGFS
jgi:hypothetical protein